MKRNQFSKVLFGLFLSFGLLSAAAADQTILNVSYDPIRPFWYTNPVPRYIPVPLASQ